jgi:LAO/AO transport system kinase
MARQVWTHEELVAGVLAGDRRAVARAISLGENGDPAAAPLLRELYPATGGAFTVGVTGPPGAGKSTLTGALVRRVRASGQSTGVLSVDPSSPFTRGALLGDRIRLGEHFLDPGVFIRSMGSRGYAGGIAEATLRSLLVLDAAGNDVVFIETVGAGQNEVDVRGVADVVLLVLMPGSGDSVQALKAGIMEIADVIALNKSDLPGADATRSDLRAVLGLEPDPALRPTIVSTDATSAAGVDELWDALVARRDALAVSGELELRRQRNLREDVLAAATTRLRAAAERAVAAHPELADAVAAVGRREVDPATAADRVAAAMLAGRAQ